MAGTLCGDVIARAIAARCRRLRGVSRAHCLPQSTPPPLRPPRPCPIGCLCGLQKWHARLHSPEVGDGAKRKGSMSSRQASTSPLNAPAGTAASALAEVSGSNPLAPQANQPIAHGMTISLFRPDVRTGGNRLADLTVDRAVAKPIASVPSPADAATPAEVPPIPCECRSGRRHWKERPSCR